LNHTIQDWRRPWAAPIATCFLKKSGWDQRRGSSGVCLYGVLAVFALPLLNHRPRPPGCETVTGDGRVPRDPYQILKR
jgi:hypothetical protein